MGVNEEFLSIFEHLNTKMEFPSIKEIFIPTDPENDLKQGANNFGVVLLEDDSVGVFFVNLSPEVKNRSKNHDFSSLTGNNPLEVAKKLRSSDILDRSLALGSINAMSQHFFNAINFEFDLTTDSMGLLNLKAGDVVGMVGFFPPLVRQIERLSLKLIIIEKKEQLVKKTDTWEVSLDPARLSDCNKILCTSTTVLNNTIDEILQHSSHAEKFSVVGPSAGFIPDPLFKLGVDVIGGTYIKDANLFMQLIRKGERWGPATEKFCIERENYDGLNALLNAGARK